MRRAIAEKCPHFHFSHALAAVLSLSAEWLLCRQGVGADGAHMDLVFHHVVQLQHVHDTDGNRLREGLPGAAVEEHALAAFVQARLFQLRPDFLLCRTRKRRHDGLISQSLRGKSQMELEDLPEVHTGWNAQRRQNDVYRIPLLIKWHVFLRKHARNHALVAVTAGKLVADGDSAELGDFDVHAPDDAAFKLVAILARKQFDPDDATALAAFHAKRGVLHIFGLLAENSVEQALLGRELRFAFWRHLTNQNIAGTYFRADPDNAFLIEIAEFEFRNVRNVVRRYFGPELRVSDDADKLLHVDGGKTPLFRKPLRDNDCVFKICAEPRQKCHADALPQSELSADRGRRVCESRPLLHDVLDGDEWTLVEGREAIRALEIDQRVFLCLPVCVLHFH